MNGDEAGPDDPTARRPASRPARPDDETGALSSGSASVHPSASGQTGPAPGPDATEAMAFGDRTEAIPAQAYGWTLGNRYRVVDRLGAGGMAEVFRAHDDLLDRDVAVKVFRSVPAVPDTAMRKERQHAELRALAQLNHPNLITLYDGVLTERPAYLVIELIDGLSLAHRIEQGPLPEAEVRDIGRQVADALSYVHGRGMVHRDVKPANILLGTDATSEDSTTRVRLSDFGIVRLLGSETMTSVGSTLGTASYLAPEQTRGSAVGPPADIYALGLTLIEAISGERSFDGPPLEAAMARLHRDPVIPNHVAGPWPHLLAAMTAREPGARPNAAQVSRALRSTAAGAPAGLAGATTGLMTTLPPDEGSTAYLPAAAYNNGPAGPPPPVRRLPPVHPDEPPEEHRRGVGGYLIAGAIVLVALLIGGILLFSGSNDDSGNNPAPNISPSQSNSSSRSTARNQPADQNTDQATPNSAPASRSSSEASTEPPPTPPSTPPSSAGSSSASSSSSSASSSAAQPGPPGLTKTKPNKPSKTKKPKAGAAPSGPAAGGGPADGGPAAGPGGG